MVQFALVAVFLAVAGGAVGGSGNDLLAKHRRHHFQINAGDAITTSYPASASLTRSARSLRNLRRCNITVFCSKEVVSVEHSHLSMHICTFPPHSTPTLMHFGNCDLRNPVPGQYDGEQDPDVHALPRPHLQKGEKVGGYGLSLSGMAM